MCKDLIVAEIRSIYALEVENGIPQSLYREELQCTERERERELLRDY